MTPFDRLKNLEKKVLGKLKKTVNEDEGLGDEFEKEIGGAEEEFDKSFDAGFDEPEKPEPVVEPPKPAPEPEPGPAPEPETGSETVGLLQSELHNVKEKMETILIHLQKIESQEELTKGEEDRVIQYLTLINEKLDHIEREHSELEKMVSRK